MSKMPAKNKRRRKNNFNHKKYRDLPKEVKFFDTRHVNSFTPAAFAGTLYAATLVAIEEGIAGDQRIGRKIHVTGIGLKMLAVVPADGTTKASDDLRVIVYQDKQANGLIALIDDIYEDVPDTVTPSIVSFRNLTHSKRFKILHDEDYHLVSTYGDSTSHGNASLTMKTWMNVNIPIYYESPAPAMSSITQSNIGILVFSSEEKAILTINARVRYLDI